MYFHSLAAFSKAGIFILFLFSNFSLNAQGEFPAADSLQQLLAQTDDETEQLRLLSELVTEYSYIDLAEANVYLDQYRAKAKAAKSTKDIGFADISEGYLSIFAGEYSKAKTLIEQGIATCAAVKDTANVMSGYAMLGEAQMGLGDMDGALASLLESLKLAEATESLHQKATTEFSVGKLHYNLNQFDKALVYFNRAVAYFKATDKKADLATNYYFMAGTYNLMHKFEQSEQYFLMTLQLCEEEGMPQMLPYIYNGLTALYNKKEQYDLAAEYGKKSLTIFEAQGNIHGQCSSLSRLGSNYYLMNDMATAIKYYEKALPLAERTEDLDEIAMINRKLAQAYRQLGRKELAYQHLAEAYELKDTIYSKESAKQLAEMETKYETEQIQKDLLLSEEQATLQATQLKYQQNRTYFWGGIAVLLGLLLGALYWTMLQRKRKNAIIKKQHEEKEVLLRELHHRVKNNLQVVSSILSLQSHKTDDAAAKEAITDSQTRVEAMGLIHQKLYQKEEMTSIAIEPYIKDLSEMIFDAYGYDEESANLVLEVEQMNMDVETAIPLGLIINEVISNSFKHGFPDARKPEVKIVLKESNQQLHLQLSDNGVGLPADFELPTDKPRQAKSFGTQLLSSLAQQLQAELKVVKGGGGRFDFLIRKYKLA